MSDLPPSEKLSFVQAGPKPMTVVSRSSVEWWQAHWDPSIRRSRMCEGRECPWCGQGLFRSTRYVIAVELEGGSLRLLELRERHRDFLERLHHRPRMGVGSLLRVRKEGEGKNARVEVELLHQVPAIPIEIAALVRSLGHPRG